MYNFAQNFEGPNLGEGPPLQCKGVSLGSTHTETAQIKLQGLVYRKNVKQHAYQFHSRDNNLWLVIPTWLNKTTGANLCAYQYYAPLPPLRDKVGLGGDLSY